MSSDSSVVTPTVSARALASRRNGAKSRGPKTAAGKARSARNALKHGLCARKFLMLPDEDSVALAALEKGLIEELVPVGALQTVLAQQVVAAVWRLMRADRFEVEVLETRRYNGAGFGLALVRDGNGTRSFETVRRYRAAAMSDFKRALAMLQALQARTPAEAEPPAPPVRRRGPRPGALRNEPRRASRINALTPEPVSATPLPSLPPATPSSPQSPIDPSLDRHVLGQAVSASLRALGETCLPSNLWLNEASL